MTREKAIKQIQAHLETLRNTYKVREIYLFGSIARGDSQKKSDIDILVEFSSKDVGLFEFVRLKEYLESILKRKVDLVTRDAIKSWMIAEIENDLVRAA